MFKGINEFKKGHQPGAYLIMKCAVVVDTTSILS